MHSRESLVLFECSFKRCQVGLSRESRHCQSHQHVFNLEELDCRLELEHKVRLKPECWACWLSCFQSIKKDHLKWKELTDLVDDSFLSSQDSDDCVPLSNSQNNKVITKSLRESICSDSSISCSADTNYSPRQRYKTAKYGHCSQERSSHLHMRKFEERDDFGYVLINQSLSEGSHVNCNIVKLWIHSVGAVSSEVNNCSLNCEVVKNEARESKSKCDKEACPEESKVSQVCNRSTTIVLSLNMLKNFHVCIWIESAICACVRVSETHFKYY